MRRGISLVALIVTIIVLIILTSAVVFTAFDDGLLDKTKEARFKSDLKTFQEDLTMYILDEKLKSNHSEINVEYTRDTKDAHYENMKKYIDILTEEYGDKLQIVEDEIVFIGKDEQEKKWAEELGIETGVGYNEVIGEEGVWKIYENANFMGISGHTLEGPMNNAVIPNTLIIDGQKVDIEIAAGSGLADNSFSGTLTVSEGLTLYGLGNQPNITKIILEKDVSASGSVFSGCTGVEELVLYNVKNINLSDLANLKTITIKKGAGKNITSSIGDSVKKIIVEDNGIINLSCSSSNLSEIVLGENVTISDCCFNNCDMLTSLKIPGSTKLGGGIFTYCENLTNVELGEGITNIPRVMFAKCTSLTNINIPNSVTTIENNAFNGCTSLTNITIPANVGEIGKSAFVGCTNLTITVKSQKAYDALIESGFTDETKIVKSY